MVVVLTQPQEPDQQLVVVKVTQHLGIIQLLEEVELTLIVGLTEQSQGVLVIILTHLPAVKILFQEVMLMLPLMQLIQ